MTVNPRRKSRIAALQALYEADMSGHEALASLARLCEEEELTDAQASGFGIIHWTTRPLDLFFTSHAKQVWQSSQDEPLRTTCDEMAARSFGAQGPSPARHRGRWLRARRRPRRQLELRSAHEPRV